MEKGLIAVDRFTEPKGAYFLTHLHADHTRGLSATWTRGPLYCSPTTANLLPSKFPGFDLSLVRILHVGSTSAISLPSLLSGSEVKTLVTVIDAHHCPGAVMYLFRGYFGCQLHTGDFRWESTCERAQLGKKTLIEALGGNNVDFLVLDNTFCKPVFVFPPREVAAQQVVDIIKMHPDHEIIIGVDTLGKEDLLLHISRTLNIKIWVWPERLQTMHLLGYFDAFTTNTSLTRVRAVPRYSLTFATLEELNTLCPTIGIMPTGLPWGHKTVEDDDSRAPSLADYFKRTGESMNAIGVNRVHEYAYSVPYSTHSCFPELEEFIKIVQPTITTGIVKSSNNPRHYLQHLYGTSRRFRNKTGGKTEDNTSSLRCRTWNDMKASKNCKMMYARLSVRRSRVCILRRGKRGAKIEE